MANNTKGSEPLRELLITSKDGDWGKDTPQSGYIPYRVIRGADFPNVRLGNISSIPICYLDQNTVGRRTLSVNDIIIETAGGNRDRPTGRTLLVTDRLLRSLDLPVTCASFCRFLRVDPNKAYPPYVFWYLQYLYQRGEMWEHQVQHTGVARFQYTKFAEATKIPLPSPKQQKVIAEILSAFDSKIEVNHKMNATLEHIAEAVFKSWFVDFDPIKSKSVGDTPEGLDEETASFFPHEFEECELGQIPKGWLCKQLVDVFEINPQRRLSKGQMATYLDMSSVPTSGHRPTRWIQREMGSGMKFVNGDTLLARITPCLENGKTAFVDFLADGETGWGSTEFIVLRPKQGLPNYFAYLLCRHNDFRAYAIQSMTGTSGRQRVQPDQLGKYKIAVPPPQSPIGSKFGELIMPLVKKISQNSEEIQRLADLRDTLLPRLISGQLPIPDTEQGGVG